MATFLLIYPFLERLNIALFIGWSWLENLEYCTPRENINHAVKNGLIKSGASHKLSKISHAQVLEIRNLLSEGLGSTEISRAMGISRYIVNDIKRGKTHKAVLT
jgi:hypothetical protein